MNVVAFIAERVLIALSIIGKMFGHDAPTKLLKEFFKKEIDDVIGDNQPKTKNDVGLSSVHVFIYTVGSIVVICSLAALIFSAHNVIKDVFGIAPKEVVRQELSSPGPADIGSRGYSSRDASPKNKSSDQPNSGDGDGQQAETPPLKNPHPLEPRPQNPKPKPERSPSRVDELLAARTEWQLHGVRANPNALALLRSVSDKDGVIFDGEQKSAWDEIIAAQNVLRASEIRLSAATLSRLPVYVKSIWNTDGDLKIMQEVIERLVDVGFTSAGDEQHAAVTFVLGARSFDALPDQSSGAYTMSSESVSLSVYAVYNDNNAELFQEVSLYGHAKGLTTKYSRNDLELCALLDAALSATSQFIKKVGVKNKAELQSFRRKC